MHVCIYACMHVCMYACMHVCMDAWMHACMDAWMDGCVDGCMYVPSKVSFRGLIGPKMPIAPQRFPLNWASGAPAPGWWWYILPAGCGPATRLCFRPDLSVNRPVDWQLVMIDYSWSFLIFIDHWLLFYGKACCERWISSFWGRHSMKKIAYTQQFLAYVQSTSPFWLSATTRPFTKPCVWHHTIFCLASAYD
jgi:hypothetical protein